MTSRGDWTDPLGRRLGHLRTPQTRAQVKAKLTQVVLMAIATISVLGQDAAAQTCSTTSLPYSLTNGTTADASQVTGNINCAALYGLAHTTENVGIGTTVPAANLQVAGSRTNQAAMVISGNTSIYWPQVSLWFTDAASGGHTFSIGNGSTAGTFSIADQSLGLNRIFIDTTGNVGIGSFSPTYPLYVNGQAGGTTTWSSTSDLRLKKNIVEISDALRLVMRLRGVRYQWRAADEREVGKDLPLTQNESEIGFIAQEVEKVVPEAVTVPKTGKERIYSLKEAELVPVLVEAIKQQQAEIDRLRQRLDAVEHPPIHN